MSVFLSAFQLLVAAAFAQGLVTFGPIELLPAPIVLGIGSLLSFLRPTRPIGRYLVIAGSLVGTLWVLFILHWFWSHDIFELVLLGLACLLVAALSNVAAYKLYIYSLPTRRA